LVLPRDELQGEGVLTRHLSLYLRAHWATTSCAVPMVKDTSDGAVHLRVDLRRLLPYQVQVHASAPVLRVPGDHRLPDLDRLLAPPGGEQGDAIGDLPGQEVRVDPR